MEKFILHKNKKIFFDIKGEGFPLVFLHGYLESKEVWEDFIPYFNKKFKIILIDLPGHGKTEPFGDTHLMSFMADAVNMVLLHLNIDKCIMIGHSMGGYVTLEFEKRFSNKLLSFVMFHSSALNDNTQKKVNRKREIDLVKNNKKSLICKTNIPLMYAEENRINLLKEIEKSKQICNKTSDMGIIGALNGMMERKNNIDLLKNINKQILFIIGEKDDLIPMEALLPQVDLNNNIKSVVLKKSGHMGFVEEKEKSQKELLNFIEEILS